VVVKEEDEMNAWMAWFRHKEGLALGNGPALWWACFLALWSMVAKNYGVDVIIDAADDKELSFTPSPSFRQDCKDYLKQYKLTIPPAKTNTP
jgi:hypothetical protein